MSAYILPQLLQDQDQQTQDSLSLSSSQGSWFGKYSRSEIRGTAHITCWHYHYQLIFNFSFNICCWVSDRFFDWWLPEWCHRSEEEHDDWLCCDGCGIHSHICLINCGVSTHWQTAHWTFCWKVGSSSSYRVIFVLYDHRKTAKML